MNRMTTTKRYKEWATLVSMPGAQELVQQAQSVTMCTMFSLARACHWCLTQWTLLQTCWPTRCMKSPQPPAQLVWSLLPADMQASTQVPMSLPPYISSSKTRISSTMSSAMPHSASWRTQWSLWDIFQCPIKPHVLGTFTSKSMVSGALRPPSHHVITKDFLYNHSSHLQIHKFIVCRQIAATHMNTHHTWAVHRAIKSFWPWYAT